ncbi:MAG: tetratricopeptide repeat protein [Verrucomicrobiota bacterium]
MNNEGTIELRFGEVEALLFEGDFQKAGARIREELSEAEAPVGWRLLLAKLACLLGQFVEAERLFVELLKDGFSSAYAARTLAFLLKQKGQYQLALQFAEAALEMSPNQLGLVQLLGELASALGDAQRAQMYLSQAAELEPKETALGVAALNEGAIGAALELFHASISAQPTSTRSPGPYAAALQKAGRLDAACRILRQAILVRPTVELYFVQLGDLLNRYPRPVDACECFKAALALNPQSASALFRLGATLLELGNPADAIVCLEKAIGLRPEWTTPGGYLAGALLQTGRQQEAVEALRRLLDLNSRDAAIHSQLIHTLHYVSSDGADSHFVEARRFAEKFEKTVPNSQERRVSIGNSRRIRIGYVSSDLRNHSVSFFVEPLLRGHDRKRFEVYCYSTKTGADAVTERLRELADRWCEVSHLSDDMLARRIEEDQVDVLVDLNNHTSGNRLLVFAKQPAPVQVTMIGLMQTTGLRAMQYRITDAYLDPEDGDDAFYSEKRVRMRSGPFVFSPPLDAPVPTRLPVSPGKPFTFGCTNELVKVTPEVASAWAQILKDVPDSRFLYFGRSGNVLKQTLCRLGISEDRIVELPRQKMHDYLSCHAEIDLALDPFPYNGLTVNLLSCWMGVPCVTLCGDTPPARAGSAVMKRLGLPEFVAETVEDYIRLAGRLSREHGFLSAVREGLRERVRHCFTDIETHVAELEEKFEEMMRAAGA